jgi:SAM-dependent methyltransferase
MSKNTVKEITLKEINEMSYTDFVGFVNQWNVLPGSFTTLSKWKVFSNLNKDSKLLEIACTTGFSSRELALMTGCTGSAFDLSEKSIKSAIKNKEKYAPNIKIDYFAEDGYKFKSNKKFTHIVIGAALKFFPDPEKMLQKCIDNLEDGGYILASPFFVNKPIPKSLISEFETVFNIKPTNQPYKEIMSIYKGLEILFEERNNIIKETEEELQHYCQSTINRVCLEKSISDEKVKKAMFNRLYKIKEMSNKLRPYQEYSVLVLRYRKDVYPNRYVELF